MGIPAHTGDSAGKLPGRLLGGVGFAGTNLSMPVIRTHDPAATFDFLNHDATSRKALASLFLLIGLPATG